MSPRSRPQATSVLAAVALAGILALGAGLRLVEPLSSPALGAEDPYTHVVFTKESLENGRFGDSTYLGTGMYPPGLHALLGALAPLSGFTIYEWARFAPVALGVLAVFGVYALAARLGGRTAGLTAAFLTAVMPEHIFRTNLLFPTGLDLAILPALLLAFHLATSPGRAGDRLLPRERWGPVAFFLLLVPALAWTHPWVIPLFLAPALLYATLRVLRAGGGPRLVARRLALPAGLSVLGSAFAMASRWDKSDTGFADFLAHVPGLAWMGTLELPVVVLFVLLVALLGAAAAAGVAAAAALAALRPASARGRLALGAVVAAALLALIPIVMPADLPDGVDYENMLGVVPVALALVGLALAFLRPTPLGDLGASIAILLFPLTAINFFDSPFWPQRTMAYLIVGVALLAGSAVGILATFAVARVRAPSARRLAAPVAMIVATLLVAGAVAAEPARPYGWYRLYSDAEFEAVEKAAALVGEDPDAKVFVADWQPAVVLRSVGEPGQVWYSPKFFKDPAKRADELDKVPGPAYIVIDEYAREAEDRGKADTSFVEGGDYRLVLSSDDGAFRLYLWEGDR